MVPKFYSSELTDSVRQSTRPLHRKSRIGNFNPIQFNYILTSKLICYCCGLLHAAVLTQKYLNFETTNNIFIRNPTETELPSISLCFFYKIPIDFDHIGPNGDRLTNATIGQINNNLPDYSSFVTDCKVLDSNSDYHDCNQISEYQEYLSFNTKCYTLFESLSKPIKYYEQIIGSKWMVNIVLNVTEIATKRVGIFLAHTSENLDESLSNPAFLQLDTENNNYATVTFERTLINKLKGPYNMCFDYTELPCRNRVTCIRKCIMESSYTHLGAWANHRYVRVIETYQDGRFGVDDESNLTRTCYNRFEAEPCNDYIYKAVMVAQFENPFSDHSKFNISVSYPLGIETIVNYVPLQSTVDYLCFVTGVISLWTDTSVIKVSSYLLALVTKVLLKFVLYHEKMNLRNQH